MADFESIIKEHVSEDGTIPAEAIAKLTKAIRAAVGNEFVEKSRYKAKLEEIDALKGEKQTAEDNATTAEKWKTKHDALKREFDDYKAGIDAKEAKAAKEAAARAYYESKNIVGKGLKLAMRGSRDEIEALELEDGKIKDTSALDALVAGDFAGLVGTTTTMGADTEKPPTNTGGDAMTKDEIMKIKDPVKRQTAIAQNIKLFQ